MEGVDGEENFCCYQTDLGERTSLVPKRPGRENFLGNKQTWERELLWYQRDNRKRTSLAPRRPGRENVFGTDSLALF